MAGLDLVRTLLGDGKKVFAEGAVPTNLTLSEAAATSPKGSSI